MNKVMLFGRLVNDPDVKYGQTGTAITSFRIAVNRIGAKEGQQQADFIHCKSFGKSAELIGNSCRKGHRLLITEGVWQSGNYEGNDGVKKYTNECIVNRFEFIESKTDKPQDDANSFGQDVFIGEEPPF